MQIMLMTYFDGWMAEIHRGFEVKLDNFWSSLSMVQYKVEAVKIRLKVASSLSQHGDGSSESTMGASTRHRECDVLISVGDQHCDKPSLEQIWLPGWAHGIESKLNYLENHASAQTFGWTAQLEVLETPGNRLSMF